MSAIDNIDWKSIAPAFLIDFANAISVEEGRQCFIKHFGNIKVIKNAITSINSSKFNHRVKILFDELDSEYSLANCDIIHELNLDYLFEVAPQYDVNGEGELSIFFNIDDNSINASHIVTICIHEFCINLDNIKKLHKCEYPKCQKYFLANRKKPKGSPRGIRFHSRSCQNKFNNDKNIKNKYFRDYKKKKRADPNSPLSYFGYKKSN